MALSEKYKDRYFFHFTDVHNLDSIIKNGLLCTNEKNRRGINHKNIANMGIQERRARMVVPVGPKGTVHDYVPFYFSSINPMLLTLLNQKNVDQNHIIYFCIRIQRLEKDDAVFTNASANTAVSPSFFDEISNLDELDWKSIDSRRWSMDTDEEKHRKMAEVLIKECVRIEEIDAVVVYNRDVKRLVEAVFKKNNVTPPPIYYDYNFKKSMYSFYYTKFFIESQKNYTLVTGPMTLKGEFCKLMTEIKENRRQKNELYPFDSIKEMVDRLDEDVSILPELEAVKSLLQDYPPHNDSVGDHTRNVVSEMRQSDFFRSLSDDKRYVLLLASYLHDIGKGPLTKWKDGIMLKPYPDHPADAIPMLGRILTDEIETMTDEEIRMVCLLVVYHDIVGDCMMKGRDKEQIVDVLECEEELDMLYAMSYADAKAICSSWADDILEKWPDFKKTIMKLYKKRKG